ncbi:glycoside hydrolase family 92 protein, partial [Calocera cornea HHB12733]
PARSVLDHVNPLLGTSGASETEYGGMIPSVGPPFAMTQWTAMTRENRISRRPYHALDARFHGFFATHQPAIWMGDLGYLAVSPGAGPVRPLFEDRGLRFSERQGGQGPGWEGGRKWQGGKAEKAEVGRYEVWADKPGEAWGVHGMLAAGGRAGVMRFRWHGLNRTAADADADADADAGADAGADSPPAAARPLAPWILLQATRAGTSGHVALHPHSRSISGSNPSRQDSHLGPFRAPGFKGYFYAVFSRPFDRFGTCLGGQVGAGGRELTGEEVAAWVRFADTVEDVAVAVGVSYVSVQQARRNLEEEVPEALAWAGAGGDADAVERVAERTRAEWEDKLGRVSLQGGSGESREVFYTAMYHALQYPSSVLESSQYYSGFTDSVHHINSSSSSSSAAAAAAAAAAYTAYSTWDIFRAQWAFLILFAPERVGGMVRSMLQSYREGGWLPIWGNLVETNIMVGTHADSMIAEAMVKGVTGFDRELAWEAVWKDAMVPPEQDLNISFYDREPGTPVEARAGLTYYKKNGWVAADHTAEAGSRTLDYAYDDYAASVVASLTGHGSEAALLLARSKNYRHLFRPATGFMEARNLDGSWAGDWAGWTEGDKWKYTFSVMHDIPGLVALMGRDAFLELLTAYWVGAHNQHDNEPSHHIPYLYAYLGGNMTSCTQRLVRQVAAQEYGAGVEGLSGNEDCGQMSAWYIFSALGFYPLNPPSGEYVVGSPFFDRVVLRLPGTAGSDRERERERELIISAPGASWKPYVRALYIDGRRVERPFVRHGELWQARVVRFDMSEVPVAWG